MLRAIDRAISPIGWLPDQNALRQEAVSLRGALLRDWVAEMRLGRVFAAAYSHLNAVWYWTFDETRATRIRAMRNPSPGGGRRSPAGARGDEPA